MPARHRSRQRALQVLYQWDMNKGPVEDAISSFYDTLNSEDGEEQTGRDEFMEELAKGTSEKATDIDHQITANSENWKLERMPIVDRNILRMAIYEMARRETPPAVVIDEALELARQFSGEESVSFINGVLDAVHKEIKNLETCNDCWEHESTQGRSMTRRPMLISVRPPAPQSHAAGRPFSWTYSPQRRGS